MDSQRSKAVTEAFVRLYKEGLIYRLVFHNRMCYHFWYHGSVELMSSLILCYVEFSHITLPPLG